MPDSNDLEKSKLNINRVVAIVIGVVIFVAWFYNSVIIPIKQQGIQLTQIQAVLLEQGMTFKDHESRINVIENKLKIQR